MDKPVLKQTIQDCVQTAASQLLSFYNINKTVEEIKKEVPVYITSDGKPLGSSLGHIAAYFTTLGFQTTIHTVDIELFDRSWNSSDNKMLKDNLLQRRKYLRHSRYEAAALDMVVDGYVQFLNKGGTIEFPIVDEQYISKLLEKGPVYAVVSYNFLNQVAKYSARSEERPTKDAISGSPSTHVIIITKFNNGLFEIIDPDYEFGGKRSIPSNLLIGAFYLAETDFDPMLITLSMLH